MKFSGFTSYQRCLKYDIVLIYCVNKIVVCCLLVYLLTFFCEISVGTFRPPY